MNFQPIRRNGKDRIQSHTGQPAVILMSKAMEETHEALKENVNNAMPA